MHDHESDVLAAQECVLHVHRHIWRVLRKFPARTVPKELTWAMYDPDSAWNGVFVRVGRDEVELIISCSASIAHRGQFPSELLNAPEQDIHVWARAQYWTGVKRARAQEERSRQSRIADLEAAVRRAERALANARAEK